MWEVVVTTKGRECAKHVLLLILGAIAITAFLIFAAFSCTIQTF